MKFGYTLVTQDNLGAAFGQILPPLSTARGHYGATGGTTTRSGSWWIATDVIDKGGGEYEVSGDYIYNLARAKYESSLGDTVTSNGLFMAQPLTIDNGIIYAYIPVSFTLDNVITNLEISNRTLIMSKGSVTFEPWYGGALFTHQPAPTPDASLVAAGRIPILGLQDCYANVPPLVLNRAASFIVPYLWASYPYNFANRVSNGRTSGIYYKAASPCCWTYAYPGLISNKADVGVAEDLAKWLNEYYRFNYDSTFASVNCFCGFEYSDVVPDYIEYI